MGNTLWEEKHLNTLKHIAENYLPHGSGFDNGTKIDIEHSRENKLIFYTSFHHMNENGMYDGWTDHTIIVTPSFTNDINVRITGENYRDIKDYIIEEFGNILLEEYEEIDNAIAAHK